MFLSRVELGPHAAEQESFWREVSQPYGAHRALWSLFSRGADQKRDFLFRAEELPGRLSFLVLSAERPSLEDRLWQVNAKPFAPVLERGQRLGFRLRASPVVSRSEKADGEEPRRSRRHDVVMDELWRRRARGESRPEMMSIVRDRGLRWLGEQASRSGFALVQSDVSDIGDDGLLVESAETQSAVRVDGYRQHQILRRGDGAIRYSTIDFEGLLEVTEPKTFLAKVVSGFGPEKAFGCGLMLLKRG